MFPPSSLLMRTGKENKLCRYLLRFRFLCVFLAQARKIQFAAICGVSILFVAFDRRLENQICRCFLCSRQLCCFLAKAWKVDFSVCALSVSSGHSLRKQSLYIFATLPPSVLLPRTGLGNRSCRYLLCFHTLVNLGTGLQN